jgi:putative membrane protein
MHIFNIFKVKKEERWLVFIMLAVFLTFNILLITSHYHVYTMGAHGGFWSIFTKNFRMSGYDNWSWITISGMRIHFITSRHPLYLTFLYPLYLLNHWLIEVFGHNFAVYFMAAIIVLSAFYAAVFAYRIFREVMELRRFDSTLLTVLLFSFGHILIPSMVPDHFIVSMMFLLMALYICGKKMKKGELLTAWQSLLLTFFTAGMATSNGAKIFLAGLFTNRKKFFTWKYISIGVILPCLLLIGIQQSQYYLLEVPQKAVISNIEKVKRQKDPKGVEEFYKKRNAWQKTHLGQTMSKESMLDWLDTSTPRTRTLVENFFGESIQLHQRYLLKDVAWDRPVFVTYNWITNYVIEAIMVVLFVLGIIFGYRKRFFQMLLAWFACDITLHLILGFGITEVYIMASGWAFIIPIAYGYLIKGLSHRYRQMLRGLLLVITIFLWAYNGGLTVNYLLNL